MKKVFLCLLILSVFFQTGLAQTSLDLKVNVESATSGLSKGEAVVKSVRYAFRPATPTAVVTENTKMVGGYYIDFEQKGKAVSVQCASAPKRFLLTSLGDDLQSYWDVQTLTSLPSLSKLDDVYGTRSEQEEDVMSYVSGLEKYGYTFDDPYLLSYLYTLLSKISPARRLDGFPYNMNIVIVNDDSMNACVFPNGTMMINTGLLANVHTEDELVAVMAHEVGHFAANHVLVSIQKREQRQKRAEAWAAFATVLAAGTETYLGSQGYYTGGAITLSTAVLSSTIAANAIREMGINFTKEQESDADMMAVDALGLLGYDKNALSTVLSRMVDLYNEEGNWAAYYLSGDHPSLEERISNTGTPNKKVSADFEKKVSFAVTNMAISKYNLGRFSQALRYVDQNIKNGVATDDDYLIKANCIMNLKDDTSSNAEALTLIKKAKEINSDNINILKTEIMAALRLKRVSEARNLIAAYQDKLTITMEKVEYGSIIYKSLSNEFDWARKMDVKISNL